MGMSKSTLAAKWDSFPRTSCRRSEVQPWDSQGFHNPGQRRPEWLSVRYQLPMPLCKEAEFLQVCGPRAKTSQEGLYHQWARIQGKKLIYLPLERTQCFSWTLHFAAGRFRNGFSHCLFMILSWRCWDAAKAAPLLVWEESDWTDWLTELTNGKSYCCHPL